MTSYILFVIIINSKGNALIPFNEFERFDDCLAEREFVIQKLGRPLDNYQAICVKQNADNIERFDKLFI